MNYIVLLSILLCIGCVHSQNPCFARIAATARPGASWNSSNTHYQVYDITVTNAGTCSLTRVVGYFSPAGGAITEVWNYDSASGLILGYGAELRVGQVFTGAGFVLANSTGPVLALDRPACNNSCYNNPSTQAPTTTSPPSTQSPTSTSSPSTSAPSTSAPTTTSAPSTSAPTTTSAPSTPANPIYNCSYTIDIVRDVASSWIDAQGRNNSIFRLVITNTGLCKLTTYALSFGYSGTLISTWNLQGTRGGYLVTGFGSGIAPGTTYSGAGAIFADTTHVNPYGYGSLCECNNSFRIRAV